MTERASIHQSVQVGVETTPGVTAAATRRLAGVSIALQPKAEIQTFKAGGSKYASVTAKGKEWSEGSVSGVPCYTELQYLLAMNYGNATVTDNEDGTYTWTFGAHTYGPDDVVRLTVEEGGPVRAHRASNCVLSDLTLKFDRPGGSQEVSGSLYGTALVDGVTMTSNPTALDLVPVTAEHVTVYLDDNVELIGSTPLNRAFNVEIGHTGRFSPVWALKRSATSYVADVEGAPELKVTLTCEADAQGMALMATMRNSATKYLRVEAVFGSYRLTFDAAVKVSALQDFSDADGVFAVGFEFSAVEDTDFGGSHTVTLVNDVASF